MPGRPSYTEQEVDAAVAALADPARFSQAHTIVAHAAPGLQRVLNAALDEGGWFSSAHDDQIAQAAGAADEAERLRAIRTLVADETRLGMLVGVAVGFELAHELMETHNQPGGS
jgi:hypothetical protein